MENGVGADDCLKRLAELANILADRIDVLENENERLKSGVVKDEELTERIKELEKENERLKSGVFRDEILDKALLQRDRALAALGSGFRMTDKERSETRRWIDEHDAAVHHADTPEKRTRLYGHFGGRITYSFVPTCLGTIGTVRCSCGAEFRFKDVV